MSGESITKRRRICEEEEEDERSTVEQEKIETVKDSDDDEDEEDEEEQEPQSSLQEKQIVIKIKKGTLRILQEYVKRGVLKEGQCCSLERKTMYRIHGMLQCVLHCQPDGTISIVPCKDQEILLNKQPPHGRRLTKLYARWTSETNLYRQYQKKRGRTTSYVFPNHFYDLVRFHFVSSTHHSYMIMVPVTDLHFIEDVQGEWLPILFQDGRRVIVRNPETASSSTTEIQKQPQVNGHEPSSSTTTTCVAVRLVTFDKKENASQTIQNVTHETSYSISDETFYGIELENLLPDRGAAASVYIDGRLQGDFMLRPKQRFILERPINAERRFMFLLRGAQTASSSIYVRCAPELVSDQIVMLWRATQPLSPNSRTLSSMSESHTVLSEPSQQKFSPMAPISFDQSATTTIHFQLVCHGEKRDILPLSDCRSLVTRASAPPPSQSQTSSSKA